MNVVRVTPSVVYPSKTGSERRAHGLVSRVPSNGGSVVRSYRCSRGLPSLGRYAHEVEPAEGHVEALSGLRTPDGDPGFEFVESREAVSDALSIGDAPDAAPPAMALFGCDVPERTDGTPRAFGPATAVRGRRCRQRNGGRGRTESGGVPPCPRPCVGRHAGPRGRCGASSAAFGAGNEP